MANAKFTTAFCLGLLWAGPVFAGTTNPAAFPPELEQDLSAGTSAIYHLEFNRAETHFGRAIQLRPDHPAAYFFMMMSLWYRLTYDSMWNRDPRLEKRLLEQCDLAAEKAKQFSKDRNTRAVGYLYWGGALGARGWYHVNRGQWVRAYFSGKKGYSHMQKVVEIDPEVYDAYLGIGMYEYYAATLGPTLKALASFSVSGDRDKALRDLRLAEIKSRYVRYESAAFQWDNAVTERRFDDAREKVKVLREAFPWSPLFMWCEIYTYISEKKWEEALRLSEEFIYRAESEPQPKGYVNPYALLLSKVLYHCGVAEYHLKNIRLAKHYFDRTIDEPSEFLGWKVQAYLRRGELFDVEGKRLEALGKYRAALKYPDFWGSHKTAKQRIKEPFKNPLPVR